MTVPGGDTEHVVTVDPLPVGATAGVATCTCLGWGVAYTRGNRDEAIAAGFDHVREETGTEPYGRQRFGGETRIARGRPL